MSAPHPPSLDQLVERWAARLETHPQWAMKAFNEVVRMTAHLEAALQQATALEEQNALAFKVAKGHLLLELMRAAARGRGFGFQAARLEVDETYTYQNEGQTWTWNITKAKALIQARAEGRHIEMAREEMRFVAEGYELNPDKLAACDPTVDGLGAPVVLTLAGQRGIWYVPIDGIHRIAKAYQAGQPFFLDLLTDADNRACIVAFPPGGIP